MEERRRLTAYIRSADLRADGPLAVLPGGELKLAIGAAAQDESLKLVQYNLSPTGVATDTTGGLRPGERSSWAAYSELYLPIFSELNQRPALRVLDLSLSARHQKYDDAGETTNPKVGVRWSPLNGLTFRGSYGTSFKAPFLKDTNNPSLGAVIPFSAAVDPGATGGSTVTLLTGGGRADLKPEEAETLTAGVQIAPPELGGLKLDLTYFTIQFTDRIATADNFGRVFAQPENFGTVLTRNPTQEQVDAVIASLDSFTGSPPAPGSVEAIMDARLTNLSELDIEGIDFRASYAFTAGASDAEVVLDASYLLAFDEQFAATAPAVERLDTIGRPADLRIRGGFNWSYRGFGASAFVNYTDGYTDDISIPQRKIDSATTTDLQLRYGSQLEHGSWLDGTIFRLSIVNVFDEDPPFANGNTGFAFDPTNSLSIGRTVAFDVSHRW